MEFTFFPPSFTFSFIQCCSSPSNAGFFLTFLLVSSLSFSVFYCCWQPPFWLPQLSEQLSNFWTRAGGGGGWGEGYNHTGISLPIIMDLLLRASAAWQHDFLAQHAHESQSRENCPFALKSLSLLVKSSGPQHYSAQRCSISGDNWVLFPVPPTRGDNMCHLWPLQQDGNITWNTVFRWRSLFWYNRINIMGFNCSYSSFLHVYVAFSETVPSCFWASLITLAATPRSDKLLCGQIFGTMSTGADGVRGFLDGF